MTSTVPASPREQKASSGCVAAVDKKNSGALLDFSFLGIENITELKESQYIEPRQQAGKKKPKKFPVEQVNEDGETETVEKYNAFCLRLTSNAMNDSGIEQFLKVLDHITIDPMTITWIDLSSNLLTKINGDIFCNLNLKILNLHDNQISELKEVDKLGNIGALTKLTLHCNPIANNHRAYYRWYVLSRVPQLRSFDFSTVTKADRVTASTWNRGNNAQKKQTYSGDDD